MKVCFETFGCRLNKAEALQQEAEYLAAGWTLTERHSDADLIVVRGCSVTSHAQDECRRLVERLRRHYPYKQLIVCGCIKKKSSPASFVPPPKTVAVPTRTARAYLKVQDGCNGRCTFCIVPQFRGASSSLAFDTILERARLFIESGYHEIVVTGCNLSLFASQGKRLPELVDALAGIDRGCRIRLGSLEPGKCALDTIDAMAANDNVCRFLHLPVQSGSDRILAAMGRPYSAADVAETVEKATRLMPDLGLGCDMMTGFPGETEIDFSQSRFLITKLPFNNAHVFPFSSRPNTPAASLSCRVPHDVRSARAHELANIVKTKRSSFAKSFIGKTVEVVVESEDSCAGWTGEYLRCKAVGMNQRKSAIKMVVVNAHGDVLTGRRLDD